MAPYAHDPHPTWPSTGRPSRQGRGGAARHSPRRAPCLRSPMFPGCTRALIPTPEAAICVRHGGSGPPVLLLHGHPQTHVMWHLTAPALAAEYTVVCADLRGYGDSGKPPAAPDHESYSKRAMARDMVAVMGALGHPE